MKRRFAGRINAIYICTGSDQTRRFSDVAGPRGCMELGFGSTFRRDPRNEPAALQLWNTSFAQRNATTAAGTPQ
jgi:hypothetical protein